MNLRPGPSFAPAKRSGLGTPKRHAVVAVFLLGVAAGLLLALWWRAAQLRQAQLQGMEEIETGIRPE